MKRLKVNLNTDESELIASLDGQRSRSCPSRAGATPPTDATLSFRRIDASLTRKAAKALNQAFATDVFQKGTRLGKLRIDMKLNR